MSAPTPSLPRRLLWSAYLAKQLRGQARFPYRPLASIQQAQSRRVRAIVAHAYRNVPYYRETMRRLDLRPSDFASVADLERLPLLERDHIQRDPLYYASTAQPLHHYLHVRSGGSSGLPRSVYHDTAALLQNAAHGERERSIFTTLLGRRLGYRETVIVSKFGTAAEVQQHCRDHAFLPSRAAIQRQYLSLLDPPEHNVPLINAFQPDIIVSYGSYFGLLFGYLAASGAALHRPTLITYNSDAMSDAVRRLIVEEFGIPVFSTYQAIEAFKIGFECEQHRGLHLNLDLYPLRVVDDDHRTLPPGATGEIVISNLVNHATVLLNYRLGDIGTLLPDACQCGRTLPLLAFPHGRNDDVVALPSGRSMHPQAVRTIFTGEPDVWQYQVIQRTVSAFDVSILASPTCDRAATCQRVAAAFARVFGPEITVTIAFVDAIDRTAAGKFKPVISLAAQARQPAAGVPHAAEGP